MMRNLIVLGCAVLLAVGLSLSGNAGAPVDTDGDGVPDQHDNCVLVDNGPLEFTGTLPNVCDAQEDGDLDGYGNPCDYDADGDGATSINDAIEFFAQIPGTDPRFDPDCDGGTSINDAIAAFASIPDAVGTPGGSGLACASLCPVGPSDFACTAASAPCP
jgi:hypothetical protein